MGQEGNFRRVLSRSTSSEASVSTTSSADIAVTVNPVAEAAVLTGTVLTASGNEGTAIGLTIVAAPVDGDDNLSINISGIPTGATLNHGTISPTHTSEIQTTTNLACQ